MDSVSWTNSQGLTHLTSCIWDMNFASFTANQNLEPREGEAISLEEDIQHARRRWFHGFGNMEDKSNCVLVG